MATSSVQGPPSTVRTQSLQGPSLERLRHQTTILYAEQAIASACEMLVVSHDNQRALIMAGDLQQQLDDRLARVRIEISGRFVRIDNRRVIDQRAGDGHTLLFATTQLGRKMMQAILEPDAFEKIRGLGLPWLAAHHRRQGNIFESGELGQKEVGLEDKAHPAIAQTGKSIRTQGIDVCAFEADASEPGAFQTCQRVEESRFSGA